MSLILCFGIFTSLSKASNLTSPVSLILAPYRASSSTSSGSGFAGSTGFAGSGFADSTGFASSGFAGSTDFAGSTGFVGSGYFSDGLTFDLDSLI